MQREDYTPHNPGEKKPAWSSCTCQCHWVWDERIDWSKCDEPACKALRSIKIVKRKTT